MHGKAREAAMEKERAAADRGGGGPIGVGIEVLPEMGNAGREGSVTIGSDGECRVNSSCHAYGGGLGLNALASGGVKGTR